MGNCHIKANQSDEQDTLTMSINNFTLNYVIGKGGFGKVWNVENKKTKKSYALKKMCKAKIIQKRSVQSVINEKELLSSMNHNYLINMVYSFQDRDNLFLAMDLLTGGDLRYHINKHRKFNEFQTKFFVACILEALEYLHSNGILHRDIKPENLVFDKRGYLRVTDLGIARIWKPENSSDTSGTPGYMAPEVMCRQNHGVSVDYYALGVIVYECMMGKRPYLGRTRQEIRDLIIAKQVQIKRNEIPAGWSLEAADFINRLIQRKPMNRMGYNGPDEVKNHPWMKNFSWDKMVNKEVEPPFVPSQIEDNFHDFNNKKTDQDIQQNQILLKRNSVQNLFSGYEYDSNARHPAQILNNTTNVSKRFNTSSKNTSPLRVQ